MALEINDAGGAAKMKSDKRLQLYAQDFYCPLIRGVYERGSEQFLESKPALQSEVPDASNGLAQIPIESVHDVGVVVSDPSSSQDRKIDVQMHKIMDNETNLAIIPTTDHLVEAELVEEGKTEEVIPALDAPPTPNLGYFRSEPIQIASIPVTETSDNGTNTSQPLFVDSAVGNSQPGMVEASTEMSQKEVSTTECGIQTSQELLFQAIQLAVPPKVTAVRKEEASASTSASKTTPIVFPRVRCQTNGPEIPAKLPRLSELDKGRANVNPIYSSSVTFEFNDEESDKENDRSILRQRGNLRNLMKNESTYLSKTRESDDDAENDEENVSSPVHASSSGSYDTSSRGPILRVGLSKKRRVAKPLHPRTFDWE